MAPPPPQRKPKRARKISTAAEAHTAPHKLHKSSPSNNAASAAAAAAANSSSSRRSSIYRGVTRHRWTGRFEAHLWDKNCWNHTQKKKGRQVYLGAYDDEETAARAYDLAALKYWGPSTVLNFPATMYTKEMEEMEGITKEEYLASLRRKSSGFSRGVSKYRGVARHHHNGRWEARIGRIFGNKYLYLGTYSTQEEAAAAYDLAAIEYRGLNAVTNFDLSRYIKRLRPEQVKGLENVLLDSSINHFDQSEKPTEDIITPQEKGTVEQPQSGCKCSGNEEIRRGGNEFYKDSQWKKTFVGSSTALGLLLQSAKFKEMLEKTAGVVGTEPHHNKSNKPSCVNNVEQDIILDDCNSELMSFNDDEISSMFDFSDISHHHDEVGFLCSSTDLSISQQEADISQLPPVTLDLSLDPYIQLEDQDEDDGLAVKTSSAFPSMASFSMAIKTCS